MHDIQGMIAVVFFFTSLSVVLGTYLFTRHRERMSVIEKGLKTDEIRALYTSGTRIANPLSSLKWGIIFVGVGLAILAGMVLHSVYGAEEGVFPALIALFAGIALVIFSVIARKRVAE